ncbi:MAG: TIGR02217 family protein [Henriciella sp.]
MNGFHDVQFPMQLALGAIGGPERRTEVLTLASGREVRNANWSRSRRRWDIGGAITNLARLQTLIDFFEARSGRLFGFRFRDPLDFSSALPGANRHHSDQELGSGDGVQTRFQLRKHSGSYVRDIHKPVPGTVLIGIDGALVDTGWRLDAASGTVTFDTPPSEGALISAGFEFDCAVRFESDQIQAVIEAFGAGRVASVGLIEII